MARGQRSDKDKAKYNPKNERIKYAYKIHIRRIGKKDEKTIIAALKHIRGYEEYAKFEGFEKFNADKADSYINHLFSEGFSLSYITDNIKAVRDFLNWLERQKGYRSKINYNHIEYLDLSRNQRRTAKASEYIKLYSYDDIIKVIRTMPSVTDKEKRDKALISLQALCTLRISELRTVKLKNVINENGHYFIHVTPKSMNPKFAKTRQAVFVGLPEDIKENVLSWIARLRELGFKDADPLFPKMDNSFNANNLLESSVIDKGIKSDTVIRDIFKKALHSAGYEYLAPHTFRKTLARYAQFQSPAFLNAVRQNLGHSSIDTTLSSYGQLSSADQMKIMSDNRVGV